ncbi:hypothetical protein QJS66_19640 [Kocuria rhizophila]|nr:hypothetical protein QJS66_19640 [Kocuria rhizophila]
MMRVPGLELALVGGPAYQVQVLGADLQGAAESVQRVPGPAPVARVSCCTRRRTSVHDLPASSPRGRRAGR